MTRGKKSILVVALVLALCAAMLFGATVAWFTTSVTTGTNTIMVDDYKVDLKYATTWPDTDGTWSDLSDSSQLFVTDGTTALKPGGKTGVKYIKIVNNNEYAIKATVDIGTITQKIGEVEQTNLTSDKLVLYALTTGVNGAPTFNENNKITADQDGKYTLNIESIGAKSGDTPGTAIIAIQFELPTTAETPNVSNTFTINVTTTQVEATTTT